MGRKIAIVGAGQSGLQTGIGLLKKGYEVCLYSNRTADQIFNGKVMSSQCMFDMALQNERDLGLNLWDDTCPPVMGLGVTIKTVLIKASLIRPLRHGAGKRLTAIMQMLPQRLILVETG